MPLNGGPARQAGPPWPVAGYTNASVDVSGAMSRLLLSEETFQPMCRGEGWSDRRGTLVAILTG
jgi:hypothetical protein